MLRFKLSKSDVLWFLQITPLFIKSSMDNFTYSEFVVSTLKTSWKWVKCVELAQIRDLLLLFYTMKINPNVWLILNLHYRRLVFIKQLFDARKATSTTSVVTNKRNRCLTHRSEQVSIEICITGYSEKAIVWREAVRKDLLRPRNKFFCAVFLLRYHESYWTDEDLKFFGLTNRNSKEESSST